MAAVIGQLFSPKSDKNPPPCFGLMPHRQQAARSIKIVNVPGRNHQSTRAADVIGQGVDLGRLPAARTANGVIERPPFAPAAERWALMYVEVD